MKRFFHLRSVTTGAEYRCELSPDCLERKFEFAGQEVKLGYSSSAGRLNLAATLLGGEIPGVVAGVELVIPEWEVRNYLLLPAAVYNANRADIRTETYPPQNPAGYEELQPEIHTSHLPHFERQGGGVIEQTTGDVAFPGIGYYAPGLKESRWVLTPCRNRYGNYGYRLEERPEARELSLTVESPVYRRLRQAMCRPVPAEDLPIDWKAGDAITFELRFSCREAGGIPDLFRHMTDLRNRVEPHGTLPCVLPLSRADRLIKEKYLRSNWDAESGYFMVAADIAETAICAHWQLGWVGGGMATLAMLFDADGRLRENARRNLDTVFTRGQAASGLYYGAARHGKYCADSYSEPIPDGRHLIRKNADALAFFIKQFLLLERRGETVPESWRASVRRQADALTAIWERNRQFGQWVDVETGRILIGGSACAVMAIGALTLASQYYREPRYLRAAREAARYYAAEYLERGILNGAPGEIMQACDSEAAYAMLDSLVTLWEATGEAAILKWAEMAADYCASWCVSYDYEFPAASPFGQLEMKSCGTVWANVQNKHSAPGFCTGSGEALLKLFRATGKRFYLELARDVAHALPQYVSRPDRPIAELEPGWINERVNLSDWEGPGMVGNVFRGSCWSEVSLMLSYQELPGVYALIDKREVWCFDHVDAWWEGEELIVKNPTAFPARITIFAETEKDCRILRWGVDAPDRFQAAELAPSAERRFRFD